MKPYNDAQARAYIEGEAPFNPADYEKKHVLMLAKSVKAARETLITEQQKTNLRSTVLHYIDIHKFADNIELLKEELEKI